jgi:hypothetical protein
MPKQDNQAISNLIPEKLPFNTSKSNYGLANCTLQLEKLCVWKTKTNGKFREERWPGTQAWLSVFAVSSYGNYSFLFL